MSNLFYIYRITNKINGKIYIGHSNGRNIFTLEQENDIYNKYLGGNFSINQLAKEYNCGYATMREILLRNKTKLNKEING